ncbi:MAG: hypothetical protein HC796_03895, partial [Synechococcaceae cyanobacterium RL_1_2]|nr:hypothetical protein [Synechococcaceae cyanobacterium RL_1_2]
MLSNVSEQLGRRLLKNLSFFALTFLTITLLVVSHQLFLEPANAIDPINKAANKATTWQEASFPVEISSYTSPYAN